MNVRGGEPFVLACIERWKSVYRRQPPWDESQRDALKQALAVCGGNANDAEASWGIYLDDDAPYWQGHAPKTFLRNIHRFVPRPVPGSQRLDEAKLAGMCLRHWMTGTRSVPRTKGALCDECHARTYGGKKHVAV